MDDEPLTFDRATNAAGGDAGPRCANCQAAISDQYWRAQTKIVCGACHVRILAAVNAARAKGSLPKALLAGGAVALGCGIVYAIFVQVSGIELALATILIAYLIARTVRWASAGFSGRRFQILAVVLTYVASAMGYTGPVLQAAKNASHKHSGSAAAPDSPSPAPPTTAPPTAGPPTSAPPTAAPPMAAPSGSASTAVDATDTATPTKKPVTAGGVLIALSLLFGIILASPVFVSVHSPISAIIILIGLYEAWKLSRAVVIVLDGPYQISAAPPAK